MKRRTFVKSIGFCAVAVNTYGFIRFDGENYVGDCETTTDILGPFYLPDSPVRNNLMIKGESGEPIELQGIICHQDCITPYKKAKIELWHCDANGKYDLSDEFRYRGTTFSDENGNYSFKTILPVPYDVGNGHIRPAHFHLMITAGGYQPLVTQLYFSGDQYIKKDVYASSPKAEKRILDIQNMDNGAKRVLYNVSMSEILPVEAASVDKLVGVYTDLKKKWNKVELFKSDNTIWMKNEAFGEKFEYVGNNTFEYSGMPKGMYWKLKFELMFSGAVQLTISGTDDDLIAHTSVFMKDV
jgi:catechol 1,2-dioxygenase